MHSSARARREVRTVLDAIRRIVRLLRESTRTSELRLGVSSAQIFVLRALDGGAPLSINELALRTLTHQSSVSVVVSKLAARGLVKKQRSKKDRRRFEIALTPMGRALTDRAPETAQARLIDGLLALSTKSRTDLARALDALMDHMNLRDAAPSMFFEEQR